MKFRTELKPLPASFSISHKTGIILAGSCFSENIGDRLSSLKFDVVTNPFGVLFNPLSITENINRALTGGILPEAALVMENELWHSLYHHSSFSCPGREELSAKISAADKKLKKKLLSSELLFITLGSAWVHTHRGTGICAANCHKIPAAQFDKRLLDISEVVQAFEKMLRVLQTAVPRLKVVFTVSPVKHIKDGIIENNLGKSVLLLAVDEICKKHPECSYFPAYELIIDDLRDYRFFEQDLVHPNKMAIDYVWDFFEKTYFNNETQALNKQIADITAAENHRPFFAGSEAYRKFKQDVEARKEALKKETGISF